MCKKKFVCQLTTRYAETDQMGVIHHGTYATYFELARIEWLRSLGLSYAKLETQGILLPVLSLSTEFKHPLYFEDQIQIEIYLDSDPTSIIDFSYQIFNQDKVLCTTAKTRLAFVNAETRKIMRCPEVFLNALGD
jgi:acyl-CoA thioester hydrolase